MAWTTVRKFSIKFNGHDEKVTVEIGLFCLQPLMNSQFYLLSWNWHPGKWLINFPKSGPPHMLQSCESLLCWANRYTFIMDVCLTISEHSAPFSDMLHSHYSITIYFNQLPWISMQKTCSTHTSWITPWTLGDQVYNVTANAY